MRTGSLTCEACHGSLPIPVELVLSTPCPYCGRDAILPDQRERREAIERAREAEARRRHDALKSAERERTHRLALRWKVIGALVAVLLVVGPIAYLVRRAFRAAEEERVARSALVAEDEARHRRSGLDRLQEMIDRAQGGACGEVFVKPSAAAGLIESRFSLGVRSCARILATTGDPAARVELAIVGGDGVPVTGPAPAREIDHLYCLEAVLTHCSAEGGKHSGTVDAALMGPFTVAAVSCPMRTRRATRRGR